MPSTRSRGEPVLPFDPELNRTLCRMNEPHYPDTIGDGINLQLPLLVDGHNQVIMENPDEGTLRRQSPASRLQEYYKSMLTSPIWMELLFCLLYHKVIRSWELLA